MIEYRTLDENIIGSTTEIFTCHGLDCSTFNQWHGMFRTEEIVRRFGKLSVPKQSCILVVAAILGADLLTLIFYGMFFSDRLLLDLLLTTLIVVVVAFPLAFFVMNQQARLTTMAEKLDRAARTDDLTGLSNRKTFFDQVRQTIQSSSGSAGCLLFIDADHFKSINDTYGHATGDVVLLELGAIMKSSVGGQDLVARLGGEEFAVFLVGADRSAALRTAEALRLKAHQVASCAGIGDHQVSVSIGISIHRTGLGLEDLLLEADKNLYAAKKNGRDRVMEAERVFPGPADVLSRLRH
ncbi:MULTISPECIES: GGDEF domain-containing protein [Hyphomicrobiales]|uniref:GGDEF domain-containing protein n=1 Tax=Hyphomicrobiales TaxID=356 RepID=UPI00037546BB|nr:MULTISPECIES: GGDEF domain-containing protein [Phyllobacteriaceae]MCX8568090.1 GGDEF domain-containing protein [Aminobacter sp. MET-1]